MSIHPSPIEGRTRVTVPTKELQERLEPGTSGHNQVRMYIAMQSSSRLKSREYSPKAKIKQKIEGGEEQPTCGCCALFSETTLCHHICLGGPMAVAMPLQEYRYTIRASFYQPIVSSCVGSIYCQRSSPKISTLLFVNKRPQLVSQLFARVGTVAIEMAARLRPTAARNLFRSLAKPAPAQATFISRCASSSLSRVAPRLESALPGQANPLALSTIHRPTSIVRYASSRAPGTIQRPEKEDKFAAEQLQPHPELVSTSSSIHPVLGEVGEDQKESDVDMMAGIRHDIVSNPSR